MKEKQTFIITNNDTANAKKIRWFGYCESIEIDGRFTGKINNKYYNNIQTQDKLLLEFSSNRTTLIEIELKAKSNISGKIGADIITFDYTGYVKVVAIYEVDFLESKPTVKKKRNKINKRSK